MPIESIQKTMRRLFVICTVLAAIATTTVSFAQNAKPFVIPELKEWKGAEGQLSPSGRIIAELPCADVANALAEDYNAMFGKHLTVIPKAKAQKGDIVLKLASKKKNDNPESYTVNIGDNIEVTSTSPQGLYWATRTLLQIAEATDGTSLPKGTIKDCPDFGVRGFMIDCGRKYIPITYLEKLVRIMGYYKMNTLQVHLNDNGFPKYFEGDWQKTYAAFRLECSTYPGLTARDGYYTKKEFRHLQDK